MIKKRSLWEAPNLSKFQAILLIDGVKSLSNALSSWSSINGSDKNYRFICLKVPKLGLWSFPEVFANEFNLRKLSPFEEVEMINSELEFCKTAVSLISKAQLPKSVLSVLTLLSDITAQLRTMLLQTLLLRTTTFLRIPT